MPPDKELHFRAYLVGDAGDDANDVMDLLEGHLDDEGEEAVVVFLGDNIYPSGLPEPGHPGRDRAERRIDHQLNTVRDFEGEIVFIPGNHDWDDAGGQGVDAVRRQEEYVEASLDRGNTWLPDDGFPGPAEIKLTDRLTLIAIDSQWWMTKGDRPFGETDDYDLEQPFDFIVALQDEVRRNRKEDLLVVGHHPLLSSGPHGGYFPLKHHIFPLTALSKSLYVPLPLVGSLFPLYVRFFGGRQDLAFPRYKSFRQALTGIFSQHLDQSLIYAAGHEHSLQWFSRPNDNHFITSGAGHEAGYVSGRGEVDFAARKRGYARLSYFEDGSIWLEMWSPDAPSGDGLLFRTRLRARVTEFLDPQVEQPAGPVDYSDSTVTVAANPNYAASPIKRILMGSHHREAWGIPVTVPVLDLGKKLGGLTPVKRGGGMQTLSLRLEDEKGREYVLRSIDKDPTATVPEEFQGSMVVDIVQDQIAALHPYGAFIIPKLADAAGIYHTNPELVYVPDDPRLGIYREEFGNSLMMFEDRPDDDMTHQPSFGRAPDVVSSSKMFREINADNDFRVNQQWYLRARLFDILLSDWDRHKDQWRWAEFEPLDKQGKIYRPIPRDRDWAFNHMNGFVMSIYKQLDARFQSFTPDYGYLLGYTVNGGSLDRRFTNEFTRSDWIAEARHIRERLTDEVIESAIADWPAAIEELDGDRFKEILISRRDALPEVAEKMYLIYSRAVDLVGSDKHERFEVERINDEATLARIIKTSKEGEERRILFERTFLHDETRELRLFGFDGNDRFIVSGTVNKGLRVVAVGGAGEDRFSDTSRVRGTRHMTVFYDTDGGNEWDVGRQTRVVRSDDPAVNAYDPFDYRPNQRLPQSFIGYNSEDGLLLGGGIRFIRHGFRKDPYASSHMFRANISTRNRAINARYDGLLVSELRAWDVGVEAGYLSPNSIRVFYGMGNETKNTEEDASFYESQLTQGLLYPFMQRHSALGLGVRIGPRVEYVRVREDRDRSIGVLPVQPGVSEETFDDQFFAGAQVELDVNAVDNNVYPLRGIRWLSSFGVFIGLNGASDDHAIVESAFSFYATPAGQSTVTMTGRLGGRHVFGTFPFYHASALGQKRNLRGYRSTRFAGRSSFYQNLEIRARLLNFSTYAAVGKLGILGFIDNGRVWTDGEKSKVWHQGYGVGLWTTFFDVFALTGTYGRSVEDNRIKLKLGFLF